MNIVSRFRSVARFVAAASILLAAQPAFASSSNAADIAAPLRAAQAARPTASGNGDDDFRQLFASWRSLDKTALVGSTLRQNTPQTYGQQTFGQQGFGQFATRRASIPSSMPVDGVHLTSDYGMRWHPVMGGRRAHKGVDLAGPVGTPIRAPADGTVSKAEWFSSYGLYVALEHGADIQTRYGHMSRLNVYPGQVIRKGDVIGYIGSTGRSTGPHLHYEVRIAGEAVNPLPYMQGDSAGLAASAPPSGLVAISN